MQIVRAIVAFLTTFETPISNAVRGAEGPGTVPDGDEDARLTTITVQPRPDDDVNRSASPNTTSGDSDANRRRSLIESELRAELQTKGKQITDILESLLLKGYTFEEIKETVRIDFSSMSTAALPEDDYEIVKFMMNAQLGLREMDVFRSKVVQLHPSQNRDRNLSAYNNGILAVGIRNFVSIAARFCEDEGRRGEGEGEFEIVSVGSGDGGIEREIMAEYRERFGRDLQITLVDPAPEFAVDFKTVAELIEKRPRVVGDCVLLVIWPEQPGRERTNYDIDAILELRPRAVLTLYETTGSSGSNDFCKLLHRDICYRVAPSEYGFFNWMSEYQMQNRRDLEDYDLGNYTIEEVTHQKLSSGPLSGTSVFRVVKMKRV